MRGIIDIHSHILPGLDDGAKTLEEAVEAVKMAQQQGVGAIIATPHILPDPLLTPQQIRNTLGKLRTELQKQKIDVEIYEGAECYYYTGLVELLDQGKVLTLAGSRYVLVEFDPEAAFSEILHGLHQLQQNGYYPILAHYERYVRLQSRQAVRTLKEDGIFLQMNFDTIQRVYGKLVKHNPFRKDILDGYVDFFGSDCHGVDFRKYFMVPSLEWLQDSLPAETYQKLVTENPQTILKTFGKEDHVEQ